MSTETLKRPLSYADAGVSIDTGNAVVDRIRGHVARTRRPGVIGGIGGFAGLFELPSGQWQQPVLVSGTDGVGTKLRLAIELDRTQSERMHGAGVDGVGIDLVAMCVNDIIVTGAEPLWFLDYYATGQLDADVAERVIASVADGCVEAGCALLGGEIAEMPDMYQNHDFDLAGFAVGVVDKPRLLDGTQAAPGDVILGLASSGAHSNGYSLIRKIVDNSGGIHGAAMRAQLDGQPFTQRLLEPTRIYVKPVLTLLASLDVHGLAHITGGGITENLPRCLPPGTEAEIDPQNWERSQLFDWLETQGPVDRDEMLRTFNCGIGMAIIMPQAQAADAEKLLTQHGETVYRIGRVSANREGQSATARVHYT